MLESFVSDKQNFIPQSINDAWDFVRNSLEKHPVAAAGIGLSAAAIVELKFAPLRSLLKMDGLAVAGQTLARESRLAESGLGTTKLGTTRFAESSFGESRFVDELRRIPVKERHATPLNFDRVIPPSIPKDTVTYPTISQSTYESKVFLDEGSKTVERWSVEGRVYTETKDSTVRVFAKDGVGSGFFIDDGIIATSEHVVRTGQVVIELPNGKVFPANLIARDLTADWALIRVEGLSGRVKPLELASPAEIEIRKPSFLLGHPRGVSDLVMTRGRLVGLNEKRGIVDVLHTSESAPGFSGSPLVLENGRVAGIHNFAGDSDFFTGIALQTEHLRPALTVLKTNKKPSSLDWLTYGELRNSSLADRIHMTGSLRTYAT